jgi:hypothetical protein
MLNYRRWAWVGIAAAVVAAALQWNGFGAQPALPEMNVAGTIEGVKNGVLVVKTVGKETWAVQVSPQAKVEVKGKVKSAFLSPGQYVQFTATVDTKTGKAEDKVSRLTLFTPNLRVQPGALPDQGFGNLGGKDKGGGKAGGKDGDKGAFALPPFGGNAPGGFTPGGTTKGRKTRTGGGKAPGAVAKQSLDLRGQIGQIKDGVMSVQVPGFKTVTVELADDAEVELELEGRAGLAAAIPGATVQLRGQQVGAQAEMQFGRANDVQITLSRELNLSEPEASGKKKGPKGVRSKRPAETGDEPAPAGDAKEPKDPKDAKEPNDPKDAKEPKKGAKRPGKGAPKQDPDEPAPAKEKE